MEGNELYITQLIVGAIMHTNPSEFIFAELGVGTCGTTKAVCEILDQLSIRSKVIGMDLDNDPFHQRFCAPVTLHPWWAGEYHEAQWGNFPHVGATLLLKEFKDAFAEELKDVKIHCSLIDGCHCEECVERDFLLVEQHTPSGGIVIFHDASPMCQDRHPQSFHGNKPLKVRSVLGKLGLLDNTRPDWIMSIDNIYSAHGIAAFQKK